MIRIVDIEGNACHQERFVRFGWDMLRSLPHAIPPFLDSERALLDSSRNVFFRHGGRLKALLALDRHDRVRGRIGAMIPADIEAEKLGWIGLFHGHEDYRVFEALMDSAADWLRQQGCTNAWGPIDFSIWHRYRFAGDSFGSKPFIGEPRNPPHYPRFFERYGFGRRFAWRSDLLDKAAMLHMAERYQPHWLLFEQAGYREELLDAADTNRLMDDIFDLVQATYTAFPAWSTITREEFEQTFAHLPRLLDRAESRLIVDPAGNRVGFVLVMKDLAEALSAMRGKNDPLARLKFLRYRHRSSMANLYQAGVRPDAMRKAISLGRQVAGSPLSLTRAIGYRVFSSLAASRDYDCAMVSLMRAGNPVRNHTAAHAICSRNYYLYELALR